ncbi:MAG: glycosyltransferase family 4 protein [Chloroflexota bacterium]
MSGFRILTWHVHGSYLDSLARTGHRFYIPVKPDPAGGYAGRWPEWDPDVVVEVPVDQVRDLELDAILFQHRQHWEVDQYELLSPEQRRLPRLYVEHDPPRDHPTDTRHPVEDPDVLLVHVTAFNALMWDSGPTPTRVIDHGVAIPAGVTYTGESQRGIVVVNDLATRGRRLGADLYLHAAERIPLDLVGMGAQRLGGIGEIPRSQLPEFEARYRFFFNPIRYTSLGLSMIEAMHVGLPIVAFATTEIPTVIEDGVSGITATDPGRLLAGMEELLADHGLAVQMGTLARAVARERFSIERFARDWTSAFEEAIGRPTTALRSHPVWSGRPNGTAPFAPAPTTPAAFARDAR